MIRYEENGLDSATIIDLANRGHELKDVKRMAIIKAIEILPDGKLKGVGDKRNPDDHAEGY